MVDANQLSAGLLDISKDPQRTWKELGQLSALLAGVPMAKLVLVDAATRKPAERRRLLKQTVGSFSEPIQQLALLLAAEQSFPRLDAIRALFEAAYKTRDNLASVTIETPAALTAAERDALLKKLPLGGRTPLVTESVRPELIGGVRVTIDDELHDSTLLGALRQVERDLVTA